MRNIKSDFFMLQLSLRKDLAVLFLLVCVGFLVYGWFGFGFGFFSGHTPRLFLVEIQGSVSKRSRDPAEVLMNWTLF